MNSANQKKLIDNFYDRQTKKAVSRPEIIRDEKGNIIRKIKFVDKDIPKSVHPIFKK